MLELLVVVFVGCKCLMPSHIYRGGLPSSRDSREFYNVPRILDIYMCWKSMEYSRIFTSSFVQELPRSFWNWAKLALLALCWLSSLKLWISDFFFRYRLGRPSKQYAAWYKPVPKTARLAIAIITMLNNQSRASRLSFADVIKKVSKFKLPNKRISKCAFVSGLFEKMEERRHTRSLVKKKVVLKKEINSNLRASKNKVMQATTTRFIKRIWEEFYSNYLPEDSKEAYIREAKADEELDEEHGENSEEDPEDIRVEQMQADKNMEKFCLSAISVKPPCSSKATKWDGELIRKTCFSESLYKRAIVCGNVVRFGVLQAGAYGMSQSRKRAFIWEASPEETLPEWPEPMHVFTGPELKVKLARNSHYAAVRSTANGAPFRAITVRDTIGDLPTVGNGASVTTMEVGFSSPVCDAHFIFIVVPSTKAEKHNQWKGLFGRLDWKGNFPTSVTDPHPMVSRNAEKPE
ncbi:hypothetical protein KPL70_013631 [Citrus sinensis]|nr:hypothetical protein KPL70_013631 [Citrus sinensis]